MKLALIAGQGGLPSHLVKMLRGRAEVPLVCDLVQIRCDISDMGPRLRHGGERQGR